MAEQTRAERLTADRDLLELAMADATPSQLPALVKEHRAVLAEIEKLAATPKGSVIDQIAQKRREREAGAAGSPATEVRQ